MATKHLMEGGQVVSMESPVTTDGGFNSGALRLENAQNAFVVIHLTNAAADETAFTIEEGDGTGWQAITNNVNIWVSENVATTDISRGTDGLGYTVDNNISDKIIIFRIDPASLSDGYDRVRIVSANSGEPTNLASIVGYHLPARY